MQNPLNIFRFFDLVQPQHPTRADKIVLMIGRVSASLGVLGVLLGVRLEDEHGLDTGPSFLAPVTVAALLIYFLTIIMVGIRVIGETQKVSGFSKQIRYVAWRLFLYMFLPALVLTAVLAMIALVVTHGGR
jgi:hypothetical protein